MPVQRPMQRPPAANGTPHHQRHGTRLAQYRLRLDGGKRPSEKLLGRISGDLVAFAGRLPIVGGRVCGVSHARDGWI